jgi:AcrR family transcriptional regulator
LGDHFVGGMIRPASLRAETHCPLGRVAVADAHPVSSSGHVSPDPLGAAFAAIAVLETILQAFRQHSVAQAAPPRQCHPGICFNTFTRYSEGVPAMAENERLASDDELILALAAGATVAEAAERAGVGERTVYRRLKDAEFRRAVSEVRGRAFDAAVGKLAGLAAQAVSALERMLQDGSRAEAVRAAKIILELVPRLRTFTELEERIAALEAEERKPRGNESDHDPQGTGGGTESEARDADALVHVRKRTAGTPAQLNTRLERLETRRAERDSSHGPTVAETPDRALQETGTKPPSQEVAENGRKTEIRWR